MNTTLINLLEAGIVTGIFQFADNNMLSAEILAANPGMKITGTITNADGSESYGLVTMEEITQSENGAFNGTVEGENIDFSITIQEGQPTTFTMSNVPVLTDMTVGTSVSGVADDISKKEVDEAIEEGGDAGGSINNVAFYGNNGQDYGTHDLSKLAKVENSDNQYTACVAGKENVVITFTFDDENEVAFTSTVNEPVAESVGDDRK